MPTKKRQAAPHYTVTREFPLPLHGLVRRIADESSCPCTTCSVKIVQAGIAEVVYSQSYALDTETEQVFLSAGVRLRQYTPPP